MLFRQVTHDDLGCASYLIGDEDAGVAAIVYTDIARDGILTGLNIEATLALGASSAEAAAPMQGLRVEETGAERS